MKKIKKVLLIVALFSFVTTNAQFWKKLTKRAEKAIEETVSRKVEEKSEKETEKAFDSIFNNNGKLFKGKKANAADSYSFTHKYIMEVSSKKDLTEITYYLTNEAEYMGSAVNTGKNNEEFITVIDLPNSAIHTFMDLGNQKSITSFKVDLEATTENEINTSKFTINSTGQTKNIVGYLCEEFQVTGSQLSGKVWVTQDAGVSFQKAFSRLKNKNNKGIDPSWVNMVDGLVLEMEMIDYSQKNATPIKMRCTSLSKIDFKIETANYNKQF